AVSLRNVSPQDRPRTILACSQLGPELFQEALDSALLYRQKCLGIHSSRSAVAPYTSPRLPQDVTPVDAVHQRVETPTRLPLGRRTQTALELSHFVARLAPHGVVGTGL